MYLFGYLSVFSCATSLISNRFILSDAEISEVRDEMLENIDFVFVPVECWNYLLKKYGTSTEHTAIKRQVTFYTLLRLLIEWKCGMLCCSHCDHFN